MKRIAVAMSGGVDSSFSALLLQQKGYEVFGLTMDFGLPGSKAVKDALGVAKQLRIKHYVINLKSLLEEKVIRDFCREYLSGRTPNPCVICNRYIKFGALFKKAFSLGADYLATGHYARIGEVHSPCLSGRQARLAVHRYQLKKAKDSKKDQSYFLYRLKQEHLKKINFPLGGYTKQEVRVLARKFNLPVADKSDSQEICFLQGADYRGFLKHRLTQIESFRTKVLGFIPSRKSTIPLIPRAKARGFLRGIKTRINANIRPGLIVDANGKVLGEHKGVAFYTIGQRQGLGIACGYPAFIINIDPKGNKITLGSRPEACKRKFLVKDSSFIQARIKKEVALKVKIRYNHQEARAIVVPQKNRFRVIFQEPQFAITPGQSAVFYDDDAVIGGGIIYEVIA